MPRSPRIHFFGAVYHVMARGVDGREIYTDDGDRRRFLTELTRAAADSSTDVLAHCLMGNHFHLVVKVSHVQLSVMMQRLLTVYAQWFNRSAGRSGHLFQARYKAKLCFDEKYLRTVVRYIHLNPVRAGLTEHAHLWPWSSVYGAPMEETGDDLTGFDPWKGAEDLKLNLRREIAPQMTDLANIGASIAERAAITPELLKSSRYNRDIVVLKREFTREALKTGYPLARIAEWLGCPLGSVSRYAREKVKV